MFVAQDLHRYIIDPHQNPDHTTVHFAQPVLIVVAMPLTIKIGLEPYVG